MPAPANSQFKSPQANFTLRAKKRMLDLDLSVTALAKELGVNRNTVSLAINRGLYGPTLVRIAARLGISL
jgi:plasmid maintenance system antidote protein VapI